jgi:hypothetical protein
MRGERARVLPTYFSVAPCSSCLLARLGDEHDGLAREFDAYALADAEDASFVLGR